MRLEKALAANEHDLLVVKGMRRLCNTGIEIKRDDLSRMFGEFQDLELWETDRAITMFEIYCKNVIRKIEDPIEHLRQLIIKVITSKTSDRKYTHDDYQEMERKLLALELGLSDCIH